VLARLTTTANGGGREVETWLKVIVLSAGGTLGVNARYWLGVWIDRWTSPQFPWPTVVINVTGSFAIGLVSVALARWMPHPQIRLLLITGFLGGYTTFSTFENDSLTLWERGEALLMAGNIIGSVAAGLAAVWLGTALARGLTEPPQKLSAHGLEPTARAKAGDLRSAGGRRGTTKAEPLGIIERDAPAKDTNREG
jgi:fluoride exporter